MFARTTINATCATSSHSGTFLTFTENRLPNKQLQPAASALCSRWTSSAAAEPQALAGQPTAETER